MSNIVAVLMNVVGILLLLAIAIFLIGFCFLFIKMIIHFCHEWEDK